MTIQAASSMPTENSLAKRSDGEGHGETGHLGQNVAGGKRDQHLTASFRCQQNGEGRRESHHSPAMGEWRRALCARVHMVSTKEQYITTHPIPSVILVPRYGNPDSHDSSAGAPAVLAPHPAPGMSSRDSARDLGFAHSHSIPSSSPSTHALPRSS